MFATYLAVNVYSSLDSVMLGFIKNDYEVGIYSAAVKIRTVLTTLITSLGTVLLPRMSYYISQEKWDEFKRVLKKSYNTIIMLAIPMMVYFVLAAKPSVLFLSGNPYLDAVKPMQILMPIMVISSLSNITGMQILIPTGGEWKFAFSVTCGAITDLILNFILIPQYGASGAAYATLIAELVQFVVQIFFTRKYSKGAISLKATLQVLLATIGGTVGFVIINKMIDANVFVTLLLTAFVYFGIYGLILLLTRYAMFIEIVQMISKPFVKKLQK